MTIRRSVVRLQNSTYVTEEPKTSSGTRTLDLAPSTCLMLKEHRANHEQAIDLLGIPFSEANLVFGYPTIQENRQQGWPTWSETSRLETHPCLVDATTGNRHQDD